MARTHRVTIFLDDQEMAVARAAQPNDASLGATIRRAAMERLYWLASKGRKQRPITRDNGQEGLDPHHIKEPGDIDFVPDSQEWRPPRR